jgi:hypothetical protein
MYRRSLAVLVTLTTVATLGALPIPAHAAGPGEVLHGQFNSDGLSDAAVLGAVSPNLCSTIVQYGTFGGVYLPPLAFTYPAPTADLDCPDVGVASDVNNDGLDELWVGWSHGAPAGLGYNRLVLTPPTFQPTARYTSVIDQPVFVGTAVFQLGVPATPYSVGPGGVANYLYTPGGVVPGPIRFCSVDSPAVQLADWNQDGIEGVLVAYTNACADANSGVVRIRQDGSVQQLEFDPSGRTRWSARVVNANGDRYPDVRTINQTTGETTYYINTGTGRNFLLHRAPHAHTDTITLTGTKPTALDVRANDHASTWAKMAIIDPPRYGTVRILTDQRVLYRPNPTHGRTDKFTYQLTQEGKHGNATVYLRYPD